MVRPPIAKISHNCVQSRSALRKLRIIRPTVARRWIVVVLFATAAARKYQHMALTFIVLHVFTGFLLEHAAVKNPVLARL